MNLRAFRHCEAVGRDFAEIERTNLQRVPLAGRPTTARSVTVVPVDEVIDQQVIISSADADDADALEAFGRDVLPQTRGIEAADPRRATGVPAA